jgi:transcriptional regulator with GAF, ATPase, and Fis domain
VADTNTPLSKRLSLLKTVKTEVHMVMTMSTILSSDSSIISFIQMKHTSTQHRRLKAESFESKEHKMIQRILKRGRRLRVYGFTSLLGLVGGEST